MAEDERVGRGDDHQGQGVQRDHVEEVVGQLVLGTGEEVEGDALAEPAVVGVAFHVEDHAL